MFQDDEPIVPDAVPELYMEGGFINDRSGAATNDLREQQGLPALPLQPEKPSDPIEEGISRVNDLMTVAGFQSLKAVEIEKMLALRPPTPIRGIKRKRGDEIIGQPGRSDVSNPVGYTRNPSSAGPFGNKMDLLLRDQPPQHRSPLSELF